MGKYLEYLKLRENLGPMNLGVKPESGPIGSSEPLSGPSDDLPSDDLPSDEELDSGDVDMDDDDGDEVCVCPNCGHTFTKAESDDEMNDGEEGDEGLDAVDSEDAIGNNTDMPSEFGRFSRNESFEVFESTVRKLIGGPALPDDWKI